MNFHALRIVFELKKVFGLKMLVAVSVTAGIFLDTVVVEVFFPL